MDANAALAETLRLLAPRLDAAECRWTVISSAAVALHTGDAEGVGDVDVFIDEAGAAAAFAELDLPLVSGAGTHLFRSRLFGTWQGGPLAVEVFAGFELCTDERWQEVHVEERQEIKFGGVRAYVPAAAELATMLLRFGREKDLARAAQLSASGRFPSRPGSV